MDSIVAETSVMYQDPNGERQPLRLYVRKPVQNEDGTWGCRCHAEGLLEEEREILGEDGLQALCLATRFLQVFLTGLEEHGAVFYASSDSDAPLPVALCFGIPQS